MSWTDVLALWAAFGAGFAFGGALVRSSAPDPDDQG